MAGLLRWAERVTPSDNMSGAADESWLREMGVMRQAIAAASADPQTRPLAYRLANNLFSSLYTAMRAREAVEILESVLMSGDGPADIGAQVARRAGICASEVRGTYEGMVLLDRAEEHALTGPDPEQQRARNASIRAEMHLDAGALDAAEAEVETGLRLAVGDDYVLRQLRRTLVDIHVCRGEFEQAEALAETVMTDAPRDEQWMALSARILMGTIAAEQGRTIEAAAIARAARDNAIELAEDRIALLADTLYRSVSAGPSPQSVDYESLPWGVRLGVQLQDARDLMAAQDCRRAAGLAADIVVLADAHPARPRRHRGQAPARGRAHGVRRGGAGGGGLPQCAATGDGGRLPAPRGRRPRWSRPGAPGRGQHIGRPVQCRGAGPALEPARGRPAAARTGRPGRGARTAAARRTGWWTVSSPMLASWASRRSSGRRTHRATATRRSRCSPAPSARWRRWWPRG